MKTYCKKINILDYSFVSKCVYEFLKGDSVRDNKWTRSDFQHLMAEASKVSYSQVKSDVAIRDLETLRMYSDNVANIVYEKIVNLIVFDKPLKLPKIEHFTLHDGLSGKTRDCCKMEPIHQISEYVGLQALQELFNAKIEPYQCASVRGRGQVYGKKAIEKWVRRDKESTKYVQADIIGCFKHISVELVGKMLERDIGKNKNLIKYIKALLSSYKDNKLEIGTVLSASLCNYVLSYIYRYALTITYKRRDKSIRAIKHILFYMDDLFFCGNNKKELKKAIKEVEVYMLKNLDLELHEWTVKDVNEEPIDMMGYIIGFKRTTIRYRIFKRARRQFIRAINWLKHNAYLSLLRARKIIAYFGYFKYSDSDYVSEKLRIKYIVNSAKKSVSFYSKKEETYYAV